MTATEITSLDPAQARRARQLALSLIELGETPEETRRQLARWRYGTQYIDHAMAGLESQPQLPLNQRQEPRMNDDIVKQYATNNTDEHTVTVALTIRYNPTWSQDRCEVAALLGALFGNLGDVIEKYELGAKHGGKIESFEYRCWDADEETMLGYHPNYANAVCNGCGMLAEMNDKAPNGWRHVNPTDSHVCDFLRGDGDEQGRMVTFPNMLTFSFT